MGNFLLSLYKVCNIHHWYYVQGGSNNLGQAAVIQNQEFNSTRSDFRNLPAGEYKVYLFENGTYDVLGYITIK